MNSEQVLAAVSAGTIAVKHSARRKKTISVSRSHGGYVVAVPARFDVTRNAADIGALIARLQRRADMAPRGDAELEALAAELNERYFDDGIAPSSVTWVSNQNQRFASATSVTGMIRVSDRLREVPRWVLETVLVHELAHLRVPDHSRAFHALAQRHPQAARAEDFLSGFGYGEAAALAGQRLQSGGTGAAPAGPA
ncbi:M48 metallopeptidase family protein [Brevibacterium daeguense]|nr:M48 family metallopeptidase [Brevibacterium daeguense]